MKRAIFASIILVACLVTYRELSTSGDFASATGARDTWRLTRSDARQLDWRSECVSDGGLLNCDAGILPLTRVHVPRSVSRADFVLTLSMDYRITEGDSANLSLGIAKPDAAFKSVPPGVYPLAAGTTKTSSTSITWVMHNVVGGTRYRLRLGIASRRLVGQSSKVSGSRFAWSLSAYET